MQSSKKQNQNSQRIAKNTLMLYSRTVLTILVTLYTSRIVLAALGFDDYGLYSVVSGIVILFSFLNTAMSSASQRFLSFELGKGQISSFQKVFNLTIGSHILIALLFVILAETIGLWVVSEVVNIPTGRRTAALVVYQFAIVTFTLKILQVPFNATVISHEKMSFYAYLSIGEALLNLSIAYLITILSSDKLIMYAGLLSFSAFIILVIYCLYCHFSYAYCRIKIIWKLPEYREILSFSGWSLFEGVANAGAQQGLGIILNIFKGVTLNAAMGVMQQVIAGVASFVASFQMAINPQIVKTYAEGNKVYFTPLIFNSSKYSVLLLYFFVIPLFLCIDSILPVWLEIVPHYTAIFIRIMLGFIVLDTLSGPLWMSIQAIGKIRNYQIAIGITVLLNLPLSYWQLYIGHSPEMIFVVRVFLSFVALFVRLFFLKRYIDFPVVEYLKKVVFPVVFVLMVVLFPHLLIYRLRGEFLDVMQTLGLIFVSLPIASWFLGMKAEERVRIKGYLQKKIGNGRE